MAKNVLKSFPPIKAKSTMAAAKAKAPPPKKMVTKKAPAAKKKASGNGVAAVPPPAGERRSLDIRKISNGYVVTESGYARGKYSERQTFTPTKPTVSIVPAPPAKRD